ncbi:MAG: ring-opening amidohydrolase, partial [Gammaproteobacteria bacterium]
CPLLTDARIHQALAEGRAPVTEDTYQSMAYSRGASALGVAVALGELDEQALDDKRICRDWQLSSSVASMSAGAELTACEVLVLGNSATAHGRLRIGHAVMSDPVDAAAVRAAMASAGAPAAQGIRQVFAKADPVAVVRDRRTTMLNDSDIHSTRHARAAVGGLIAGLVGDPMVYVSGGAEHQGPLGGGPVAVIAQRGAE